MTPCVRAEAAHRLHGRGGLRAVGLHDVGVVLVRLVHDLTEVVLVIEAVGAGKVLAEGVVGEENLVVGVIGDHVVRPVDHRRLHEGQRALADAEGVTGLDAMVAEVAEVRGHVLDTLRRGAVDLCPGRELMNHGGGAGVVHLDVVGDEDVDFGGVDHRGDALEELVFERDLGGVDERDLLVQDEVGVVCDARLGGVAVELAGVPVERADPVDVRLDLNCGEHGFLLCRGYVLVLRRQS